MGADFFYVDIINKRNKKLAEKIPASYILFNIKNDFLCLFP